MKKFWIPITVFALLGVLFFYALHLMKDGNYSPKDIPSPLIGKALPNFSLPVLQDPKRTVTAESLRGRVYLLNVWASWCVECRVEHPFLNALTQGKLVPIIGLDYKDQAANGLDWLKQLGNPYELVLSDANGRVGIDLGVYGVPETFVIDKQGFIRYKHVGAVSEKVWRETLQPLLHELNAN
jgi:cytochrome c biogenesis protein CcmG/thiol:disulfide interchange protein DsbE